MTDTPAFAVSPLPGGIGCEVTGLAIDRPIAPETAKALYAAWLDHGVMLFRLLGSSPEAQLRLSQCFGELEPHPIPRFRHPDHPDLILLGNENGPSGPVYDFDGVAIHGRIPWHTDLAFKTTPNAGALLRMVRKPAQGGETGWLDTALAYDALSDAMKARIATLETVNSFRAGLEEMRHANPGGVRLDQRRDSYPEFPLVANPLVGTHPETGRKLLTISVLNIEAILGLEQTASDALIGELIAHLEQPRFSYIHDWQEGDMMLWDNRRMLHCALGHPVDQIRVIHRTTIMGAVATGREIEPKELAA